jgi:excisionase family DNA binding protein
MKLRSVRETAEMLGISINTLRLWIFQKKVTYHKIGHRVLFHPDDIEQLINEGRHERTSTPSASDA